MSKYFCCNGFRLGVLVSPHNPTLLRACATIAPFSWPSSLSELAWSTILESPIFLSHYLRENKLLLGQHYEILSSWCRKHHIQYVQGGNAGFYLWVNFNQFCGTIGDTEQRETELWKRMVEEGVYIGPGLDFESSDSGWFRITFATEVEILELGLNRLEKALFGKSHQRAITDAKL